MEGWGALNKAAPAAVTVLEGDCLDVLPTLPDASVDAIVTDPPYELGFMGRAWDASGIAYNVDLWRECLRVLKPGGHLLAFGGTRTVHRLTCAIEDAGFEIRDGIDWLYGSGFPKSLDVSKAIDAKALTGKSNSAGLRDVEALRPVTGDNQWAGRTGSGAFGRGAAIDAGYKTDATEAFGQREKVTGPATDDARRWAGWGTALKPAREPIVMARKPLAGTVAANVQAYGTGALNIDACRMPGQAQPFGNGTRRTAGIMGGSEPRGAWEPTAAGRWPSNVVLSHAPDCTDVCLPGCPVAELDEPARFFPVFRYQAKAPTRERPKVDGVAHPTVKPLALMRWLVRLVTPEGGTVLDPFAGSGTTLEACALEGFACVAIERDTSYLPLIDARLARIPRQRNPEVAA